MADAAPHRHPSGSPGGPCKICGVSSEQAQGLLMGCRLHGCTVCASCCGLSGGPFAEACKPCPWGKAFWKDGKPPVPALAPDDAGLIYA